jgi:hypothetical protein
MIIPQHLQQLLELSPNCSRDDVAASAKVAEVASAAFGLSADEFASAIEEAEQQNTESYEITKLVRRPETWKYIDVMCDGVKIYTGVLSGASDSSKISTASAAIAVAAWYHHANVVEDSAVCPGLHIQFAKAGNFKDSNEGRFGQEWALACLNFDGATNAPPWIQRNSVQFQSTSRICGDAALQPSIYWKLFTEHVSEQKLKWRTLSLYRIFEHGYLSEVFSELRRTFFNSPKEALSSAMTSMESELNQLKTIVQAGKLEAVFETLFDAFEAAKGTNNRFAYAIEKSIAGQKVNEFKGKAFKGVAVLYKIRCSIVHAGSASQIFDSYDDGTDCLQRLLPSLEEAALAFLGVAVV